MRRSLKLLLLLGVPMTAATAHAGIFHTEPKQYYEITSVVQKPGTYICAVMVKAYRKSDPKGIATFPDGGSPQYSDRKATLYLVDLSQSHVVRLKNIDVPSALVEMPEPWINGWKDDSVYFRFSGQTGYKVTEMNINYYYVAEPDGEIHPVPAVPEHLAYNTPGQLNAENPFKLYDQTTTSITVFDTMNPVLKGTKIVLSEDGTLTLQKP